jgi:hypothetical protein
MRRTGVGQEATFGGNEVWPLRRLLYPGSGHLQRGDAARFIGRGSRLRQIGSRGERPLSGATVFLALDCPEAIPMHPALYLSNTTDKREIHRVLFIFYASQIVS